LKWYQSRLHVQLQTQAGRATGGSGRSRIGTSAPCQKFMQLKVLDELSLMINHFYDCQSAEDIKDIAKQFVSSKGALGDLLANCKSSIKEYRAAKKSSAKSLEAAVVAMRPQASPMMQETGRPGDGSQLFELVQELGLAVPCITAPLDDQGSPVDAASCLDASLCGDGIQPYVMHLPTTFDLLVVSEENKFQTALAFFTPEFLQSSLRKEQGRASQDMDVASSAAFLPKLQPLLPALAPIKDEAGMQDLFLPSLFGIAPNHVRVFIEKGFLPSVKLTTRGTRRVVLVDMLDTLQAMQEYYTGEGAPPRPTSGNASKPFTPTAMQSFIKTASSQVLQRMQEKTPTWKPFCATIGPQETWNQIE
jgi:hypothetical protein